MKRATGGRPPRTNAATPKSGIARVVHNFGKFYEQSFETSDEETACPVRQRELHPSSFPFCGLRHAYSLLKDGRQQIKETSLLFHYFTSVGTTVHSVMQEWVHKVAHRSDRPKNMDVLGDWKCTSCGHVHEFTTYTDCEKCGSSTQYEELGVKFGKFIVGHVDGLVRYKTKNGYRYYVIDYKTTSTHAVRTHQTTGSKFPYLTNRKQIESYCALLEHKYGIRIDGWMLIYIARDNPKGAYVIVGDEVSDKRRAMLGRRMKKYDRHFGIANWLQSEEDLLLLAREKPCPSAKYYNKEMHDEYDQCPLSSARMCWSPSLESHLVKVYRKSEYAAQLADKSQPSGKKIVR